MNFVSREEWGARPPKYKRTGDMDSESTCHWNGPTVTVGGSTAFDHSKCAQLVRGTQNFHMDARGWSDIAYNFVICQHGYVFEGRGLNVINGANGTNQGNRTSHAVMCLAGEGNPFNEYEKSAFKSCVRHISGRTGAPNSCKGHRDHKSTACPGDVRYKWVHDGMPVAEEPPDSPEESFLSALTEKEQREILERCRKMPQMAVIRKEGTSGMTSVSLQCGNTRLPLTSEEAAQVYKFFLSQERATVLPAFMFDSLRAI